MKKLLSIVLALILLVAIPCEAFAENDLSALSDEELAALITDARMELAKRSLKAVADTVLFEKDGVTVYTTGNNTFEDYGDSQYLNVEVVVINDSDKKIAIVDDGASVNGWEVQYYGIGDISAGKKKRGNIEFVVSDAGISAMEEIDDIEVTFQILDEDSYEVICTLDPVTFFVNE